MISIRVPTFYVNYLRPKNLDPLEISGRHPVFERHRAALQQLQVHITHCREARRGYRCSVLGKQTRYNADRDSSRNKL